MNPKKSSLQPPPVSRLAMFAVVLAGALRAGAQTPDPALEPGFEVLEEGRTTLNDKAVAAAQDYFRRLTEQHPEKAIYFYDLGRVNYYRCEAGSSRDDKKNVERALDEAIAEVEQSLKLNERAVDAHSLLADLYRRRITFGSGMIHGPNYGPRLKAGNKRAFELDAHDPRVCASPGKAVSQRAVWRGC